MVVSSSSTSKGTSSSELDQGLSDGESLTFIPEP